LTKVYSIEIVRQLRVGWRPAARAHWHGN